jgi:hypothetical protein
MKYVITIRIRAKDRMMLSSVYSIRRYREDLSHRHTKFSGKTLSDCKVSRAERLLGAVLMFTLK